MAVINRFTFATGITVPEFVIDSDLDYTALGVWLSLCRLASLDTWDLDGAKLEVDISWLAEARSMTPKKFREILHQLEEMEFITLRRGGSESRCNNLTVIEILDPSQPGISAASIH